MQPYRELLFQIFQFVHDLECFLHDPFPKIYPVKIDMFENVEQSFSLLNLTFLLTFIFSSLPDSGGIQTYIFRPQSNKNTSPVFSDSALHSTLTFPLLIAKKETENNKIDVKINKQT